jgi:hypothetical protein
MKALSLRSTISDLPLYPSEEQIARAVLGPDKVKEWPASWRGISYCRTSESLLRCAGSGDPAAMAQLRALPERFPEAPKI